MDKLARTLVAAASSAVVALTAQPAAAAPPEGCYGLPDRPAVFFCITEYEPENLPRIGHADGNAVTIPRFCAGECYGPITVPIPGVSFSSAPGPIMKVVYQGTEYPITVGEVPDVPTDCGVAWDPSTYGEVQGVGAYPAACAWFYSDGSTDVQSCVTQLADRRCVGTTIAPLDVTQLLGIVRCLLVGDDTFQLSDVTGCVSFVSGG